MGGGRGEREGWCEGVERKKGEDFSFDESIKALLSLLFFPKFSSGLIPSWYGSENCSGDSVLCLNAVSSVPPPQQTSDVWWKIYFQLDAAAFVSRSTEWLLCFLFGFCEEQPVKIVQNRSPDNEIFGIIWHSKVIMLEELIVPVHTAMASLHFQFHPLRRFFFPVHFCLFKCSKPPIFTFSWQMTSCDYVSNEWSRRG